jgi:hypothetical protein
LAYFRGPQANSARPSDIETSTFNVVANNMVVHNNRPNIAVAGDVAAALVLVEDSIRQSGRMVTLIDEGEDTLGGLP